MAARHESTIVAHGAGGDRFFARCNDCSWELTKPSTFTRVRWLAGEHRNEAVRAERPWVRTVDVIPGVRPVPVGTVGREVWRGPGAGDQAGTEWVQVIFERFGARDCRPDQIVPSSPGDEGLLFRV